MGVSFSGSEISLILKNKMAAAGISLKLSTFFYWLFLIGRMLNLRIGDMYNRYKYPLQPCRHLTLKLLIQGHPRSAKVPHVADFKSAYISLIIGTRGLQCETNLCAANLLMWSDLTLSAYNLLIIGPRGLGW